MAHGLFSPGSENRAGWGPFKGITPLGKPCPAQFCEPGLNIVALWRGVWSNKGRERSTWPTRRGGVALSPMFEELIMGCDMVVALGPATVNGQAFFGLNVHGLHTPWPL